MRPYTGRTHQLRAHLKAVGHPILGDPKYGDEASALLSGGLKLQLHARRIELPHPSRGALILEAPPSPELLAGFERFGFDEHEAPADPFEGRRGGGGTPPMSPPAARGAGMHPSVAAQVDAGLAHLRARRFPEAAALLALVAVAAPGEPELHRALAEALLGVGDLPTAEGEARVAIAADKRRPPAWATLAAVLVAAGRPAEAEKALRQALALDRRFARAAVRLNELLLRQGRAREAAQATAALAPSSGDAVLLAAHAHALKAEGRREDSLAVYERARKVDRLSGVAEHNVASALADLQRNDEALAATDGAFAKGLDAAETWLVRAHALQGLNRHEEAEAAYGEALRRDPRGRDAVIDLARLIWMRTGDAARACAVYDCAIAAGARDPMLFADKARLLEYAGDAPAALLAIAPALQGEGDVRAHLVAAQIAAPLDADLAAQHVEIAVIGCPSDPGVRLALGEARLAQGRASEAASIASETLATQPHNQHALAVQAAAWRILGDPRYRALYDYATLVGCFVIDTPARLARPGQLSCRPGPGAEPPARPAHAPGGPVFAQRHADERQPAQGGRTRHQGRLHRSRCADPRLHRATRQGARCGALENALRVHLRRRVVGPPQAGRAPRRPRAS